MVVFVGRGFGGGCWLWGCASVGCKCGKGIMVVRLVVR